jgi:dipeptidase E
MTRQHLLALGGGGFSTAKRLTPLENLALELTGRTSPRVCFLPTAAADDPAYCETFHTVFATAGCETTDLRWRPDLGDASAVLRNQDLIYVSGGDTITMLSLWRERGWDKTLRQAWTDGVVVAGMSAGAMCWFEDGLDFDRNGAVVPQGGLGFLPGSYTPHWQPGSTEEASCRNEIRAGRLPAGYYVADDAALHFTGQTLEKCVALPGSAGAVRIDLYGDIVPLAATTFPTE